jgi:hypothetical protein
LCNFVPVHDRLQLLLVVLASLSNTMKESSDGAKGRLVSYPALQWLLYQLTCTLLLVLSASFLALAGWKSAVPVLWL